ncbi:hypothetical protein PBAL39_15699 [Pedobacter sp. BAL39]|uniref:hypothetical protein n=1 Tax=Pedobacter sp. BAL39 TaxID=391596 RepID=UPI0001559FD6|nr:hypothetical protein [Pedobacter sp. BAL39]EDM37883.1 hypothetical protein PBAL39_15699 [Pedobacter sp. BAL39]
MNTKKLGLEESPAPNFPVLFKRTEPLILFLLMLLLWFSAPGYLREMDSSTGTVDQSIWLLILLSIMTFLLLIGLCWWLLQRFLLATTLPSIGTMVSKFNLLSIWEQYMFYLASFALLLLAALFSLLAIC